VIFLTISTSAFAGVLPFFNPSDITNKNNSFYIHLNAFLADDSFALKNSLNGKTNTPHIKSGTNIDLGDIRTDVGYNSKKYGYFGYIYRGEGVIKANEDTIKLIYLVENNRELPIGRYYNFNVSIKAFQAQGVEYAKSFDIYHKNTNIVNIGFGFEALNGINMQDGTIHGHAIQISRNDYDFNIFTNYNYTHNYLYKLHVNKASSYGYSSDLSFYVKKNNISLLLLANDIFGKLYWKNLPYSNVRLVSHKKNYRGNSLISGREWHKNFTQTLLPKYRVQLAYKHKRYFFKLGSDMMYGIYMPYIESDYMVASGFSLGLGYETRFHSITLKSQYKNFSFNVQVDNIFKPSTLGLSISYLF